MKNAGTGPSAGRPPHRPAVRGPVLEPGAEGYDAGRSGFQTAVRHRPDLVVGATGAGDVQAAVEFAAARSWAVTVQATGHGAAVPAAGGLLIDTRRMAEVRVDPAGRTAWLAAGTRWAAVVREAARYGLAPLSGAAPGVGAVGYTLGGGIGLLARRYGYAADHVTGIDAVTADGRLRHLGPDGEPELFWALRGGGGGLAVVTGMRIRLMPVERIFGGGLYFAADEPAHAAELFRGYLDWTGGLPDRLTSSAALIPMPDVSGVPEPIRGRRVLHVRVAYDGGAVEGERLAAPLRALAPVLIDGLGEMSYADSGSIYTDPTEPHGYQGTNVMLSGLDEAGLSAALAATGPDAPVPCIVESRHLGGALSVAPEVPNAVAHRDARHNLRVISPLGPDGAAAARPVHRRFVAALGHLALGATPNFHYGAQEPAQLLATHDPATRTRLAAVKTAYDPAGVLRSRD
ncbi:FAD-binding oxidoreductase [Sphaerisporangium rufum]|nr:FAD-binding oxidoreductase [Sphaerisporangium rufum]